MNRIQFNHNCQIMGDFYPLITIFVEFLQGFFTQTLKGHNSVTNKDTEMRQTFSESSIQPTGWLFYSRSAEPRSRSAAG